MKVWVLENKSLYSQVYILKVNGYVRTNDKILGRTQQFGSSNDPDASQHGPSGPVGLALITAFSNRSLCSQAAGLWLAGSLWKPQPHKGSWRVFSPSLSKAGGARLLTVRRTPPQGLVRTLSLPLIIEKAWQAAGVGKFRTLQTTLLHSACLIRLAELSEDPMGL